MGRRKVLLSVDSRDLAAIDAMAEAEKMSRSAFMVAAAISYKADSRDRKLALIARLIALLEGE
jgi:hypothetical protein